MPYFKERIGIFDFSEVFPYVLFDEDLPPELLPELRNWEHTPEFHAFVDRMYLGHPIDMYKTKYQTFARKGTKCVCCGIEGTLLALERDVKSNGRPKTDRFHFNLYAIKDGRELLMTQDHIVERSKKGGRTHISNLQPMCTICNNLKSNPIVNKDTVTTQNYFTRIIVFENFALHNNT